ncbi:myosin 1 NDAI_0D01830 [Naumovozyma dairenensis CBS 421]|uniref:Myosin motor domain-containing protein n=1 Tax=Naumovozyma dairenensis (strain ATCC 10597 / BCRC 20456 / CBS 421 / NBRC 0211 / NRRL Y-12639) TaxID=1071378 RepID=G0W9N6_NAUDC|nr:hypothetical protein NDAI_0D01830 [Naumovozyma dairenensis CBS 421]CCD24497.1 hypothetical protein NDAI_0D01830 [Naumovozyma dairenensis CBS 421]
MTDQPSLVWVPDQTQVFRQAELISTEIVKNTRLNQDEEMAIVRLIDSNEEAKFLISETAPINPTTFDKIDNMSELTHLNEPSVLYNLENRYKDDLIYTYSGLFLVAINPYSNIKIYTQEYINLFNGSQKEENKPHIFAVAEEAYQNLLSEKQNQSVLVTGESGAGKTENTKKILQYLASITSSTTTISNPTSPNKTNFIQEGTFERKILQSNPILESFGNAQTVRNNNSSRFGKFIKIEFDDRGKINGAHIEWYLLEKSRVIEQHPDERNYHIFYQLLTGLSEQELRKLELYSKSTSDYYYLSRSNSSIPGVNDAQDFQELLDALGTVGFTKNEIDDIFKIISIILHVGNVEFVSEKAQQASFKNDQSILAKLLGVTVEQWSTAILRPKAKAGREWVSQGKDAKQSRFILNSLARTLYERLFAYIVERINHSLDHGSMTTNYIGLLDIAGFEIFKHNSFEQLCINYTNEKLQQFFNHHMFILEQNEYMRENIHWDFVDFGKDLQASIHLIDKRGSPMGILPILDEESILPKSSDDSFFSKLISNWDKKSDRFKRSKLEKCFILKHYAGNVEYNIEGWLSKNKDPLSEYMLNMLSSSSDSLISEFFNNPLTSSSSSASIATMDDKPKNRGSAIRTAAMRHREQLNFLLDQLSTTHPHFVRCIIPNNRKMAKSFDRKLILDQLRCNGVLEGIRIAREGYPNRIFFKEFFQRYKILASSHDLFSNSNSKKNCEILIASLDLEPNLYKIGNTKLFFKAGVLAKLESRKDQKIKQVIIRLNSQVRGKMIRDEVGGKLKRIRAARVIGSTFRTYNKLMENPWYNLFVKIKPLLDSSSDISKTKTFNDKINSLEQKIEAVEIERNITKETNELVNKELKELRSILETEKEKLKEKELVLLSTKEKTELLEKQLVDAVKLKDAIEEEKWKLKDEYEAIVEDIKNSKVESQEKESSLKQLEEKYQTLQIEVNTLQEKLTSQKEAREALLHAKYLQEKELAQLKEKNKLQELEIQKLQNDVNHSGEDLDLKIASLEKSCNSAKTRLGTLADENADLRSQLSNSKKEQSNSARQLNLKMAEIERLKAKIHQNQKSIQEISEQRDRIVTEQDSIVSELHSTREELSHYKLKCQDMEGELANLKIMNVQIEEGSASQERDDSKIKQLEQRLVEETSLNQYLNKKLSARLANETLLTNDNNMFYNSEISKEQIISMYNDMKIKLADVMKNLEDEIEEKKNLISRLRFTETRLASSSFDSQNSHAQINKLKEIIKNANIQVELDKELTDVKPDEVNLEKMVLEVQHLKRQLEIQTKAQYDAENVASALHEKFNKIQRADSASDIFKLKYEASEERIKALENKLKHNPLKDRTNLPSGDIFINRDSVTKYEEEVRFHKLENYKLQETIADANNKISHLNHDIRQSQSREELHKEQIVRLKKNLESIEYQKGLLLTTIDQQKKRFDECVQDLHENETQLNEYKLALKQAESDVNSMSSIIEKLKSQNKQKDKTIWERETEKNELDMQLQESLLELKRIQDLNNLLNADLAHLKERLTSTQDTSYYTDEIERLKSDIAESMNTETSLKKEVATLKYKLDSTSNESESKVSELLKQVAHYSNLVGILSNERDVSQASHAELSKRYEELIAKVNSLTSTVESLSNEKSNLASRLEELKSAMGKTTDDFSKSLQEKDKISSNVAYLQETLAFQQEQNARNGLLVKQLQESVDTLKNALNQEKEKNIELYQENQTLIKMDSQLKEKLNSMQSQLSDSSEKDAWLIKIHELEELVNKESSLKYEELKKVQTMDRVIEDLKKKNNRQSEVIDIANKDRKEFEEEIQKHTGHIIELERHIDKQDVDLKKIVRDNAYYQDRVMELEKEISFWKDQFQSLNAEEKDLSDIRTQEVMI